MLQKQKLILAQHTAQDGKGVVNFTCQQHTSALLIIFDAQRGKACATKPSGDSSRISSLCHSQQSWHPFRNLGSIAVGLCSESKP